MAQDSSAVHPTAAAWHLAALVASVLPFVRLAVLRLFAQTAHHIALGDEREFYAFGFGGHESLHGVSRSLVSSTGIVFWVGCSLLAARSWQRRSGLREEIASLFTAAAIAILFFVVPMLATLWALALRDGWVPTGPWGVYEGNHGPWRHAYHLRKTLSFTLSLPAYAFLSAVVAGVVNSRTATFTLVGANLAVFTGVLGSHYWLID